jgi:hypothetical protein
MECVGRWAAVLAVHLVLADADAGRSAARAPAILLPDAPQWALPAEARVRCKPDADQSAE